MCSNVDYAPSDDAQGPPGGSCLLHLSQFMLHLLVLFALTFREASYWDRESDAQCRPLRPPVLIHTRKSLHGGGPVHSESMDRQTRGLSQRGDRKGVWA